MPGDFQIYVMNELKKGITQLVEDRYDRADPQALTEDRFEAIIRMQDFEIERLNAEATDLKERLKIAESKWPTMKKIGCAIGGYVLFKIVQNVVV